MRAMFLRWQKAADTTSLTRVESGNPVSSTKPMFLANLIWVYLIRANLESRKVYGFLVTRVKQHQLSPYHRYTARYVRPTIFNIPPKNNTILFLPSSNFNLPLHSVVKYCKIYRRPLKDWSENITGKGVARGF